MIGIAKTRTYERMVFLERWRQGVTYPREVTVQLECISRPLTLWKSADRSKQFAQIRLMNEHDRVSDLNCSVVWNTLDFSHYRFKVLHLKVPDS